MTQAERLKRERNETDALKREALKLGVEVPHHKSWWWDDFDRFIEDHGSLEMWEYVSDEYIYLTDVGKAGYRKLIRDELRKEDEWRRARVEWKIKIILSIITALTGLIGALIGVFAILRK